MSKSHSRRRLPGQAKAQVIGREAERWFTASLPPEWLFQRPTEDFGLDGTVLVAESGELTSLEFGVQIKASRSWRVTKGKAAVTGISVQTLNYWLSRFAPTMLVVFDQAHQKAYWSWVHRLLEPGDADSDARTVTLHVPIEAELGSNSWPVVRSELGRLYDELYRRLHSGTLGTKILDLLHELALVLRLLRAAHASSKLTELDVFKADLSEAVAYREAVLAITSFRDETDGGLRAQLDALLRTLRHELAASYQPIDMFFDAGRRTAAFWAKVDELELHRPRIVALLLNLIIWVSRPAVPQRIRITDGLFERLWSV